MAADKKEWTWKNVGKWTKDHLEQVIGKNKMNSCLREFVERMGFKTFQGLPKVIRLNPYYFMSFHGGYELAEQVLEKGLFSKVNDKKSFVVLGTMARQHIFMTSLYKLHKADKPTLTF